MTREDTTEQMRTRLREARDLMALGHAYIPNRIPRVYLPQVVLDVMQQQLTLPRHLAENSAAESMPLLIETIAKSIYIRETRFIDSIPVKASDYLIEQIEASYLPRMSRAAIGGFADAAVNHAPSLTHEESSIAMQLMRTANTAFDRLPQDSERARHYLSFKHSDDLDIPSPAERRRIRKYFPHP